jgi:hypothetical protein
VPIWNTMSNYLFFIFMTFKLKKNCDWRVEMKKCKINKYLPILVQCRNIVLVTTIFGGLNLLMPKMKFHQLIIPLEILSSIIFGFVQTINSSVMCIPSNHKPLDKPLIPSIWHVMKWTNLTLTKVHHLEDVGFTLAKKIGVILSFWL